MTREAKLVLDFTGMCHQDTAIMPAKLAKRLLTVYVAKMHDAHVSEIADELIDKIRKASSNDSLDSNNAQIDRLVAICDEFILERAIISAVVDDNWAPFETENSAAH